MSGLELYGRKLGMTQIFDESGERVPVTVLALGPCVVVQKKTDERDGYSAVQLGFEDCKEKHATAPRRGHFRAANVPLKRHLFECRLPASDVAGLEVGRSLDCSGTFEGATRVDVIGTTKGRGFTGVIKRYGFAQAKMTHGTHEFFRHAGSHGSGTYPGRVFKGKRMAGRHGGTQMTQLGLRVQKVDAERGLLFVRGAVPGHTNAMVRVRRSNRG
jgi:large subunit ribosomal protein L3